MSKLALLSLVPALLTAAPVLTELHPRGAQQGKTFTLTLSGRELPAGVTVVTTLPATFTPMTSPLKGLPYLVELKPDAAVGTYPIRIQSADGISNILLFTVGSFPEVEEEESTSHANDTISTAQIVKLNPVTINGTLMGADRDMFRVSGKSGERRVFEVEARRCGSAIDPVLELYDEKGAMLARNEDSPGIGVDARLDFTFPHDGNYFIEVHDARFSKQEQNFYRLLIGAYPYAESIFPLGGQRGKPLQVQFVTRSGSAQTTLKLPDEGGFTTVSLPGSPTLPFRLTLSDYPEVTGPVEGALTVPVVVNGRVAKPGEVNQYSLQVKSGESYLFELQSRELDTSHLDGLITIYDAKGKKHASAGDAPPVVDVQAVSAVGRTSGDPFLNFKVPEGTSEIKVSVEDIARRGGMNFAYRLTVRRLAEDFRLSASPAYINVPRGGTMHIAVTADRRGFDGPIQATIRNLPKGWIVKGGYIAAETVDPSNQRSVSRRAVLSLSAAADAELPKSDLVIEGEGRFADGSVVRRMATGSGAVIDIASGTGLPDAGSSDRQKPFTAAWLGMAMPAATGKEPSGTIAVKSTGHLQSAEGDAYYFEWVIVSKRKDVGMPATVNTDAPGVRDIRVIDMKASSKDAPTGTFTVTTTRATTPAIYDLVISASLMVDGQREVISSQAIPFEVLKGASSENPAKTTSGSR